MLVLVDLTRCIRMAGFGVPHPSSTLERWLAMLSMIIAAVFYAVLLGNISSALISLDSSAKMYQERIDQVNQYAAYKNLTSTIKKRLTRFYELKYSSKYFDEDNIMKELNEPLRQVSEDPAPFRSRQTVYRPAQLRDTDPEGALLPGSRPDVCRQLGDAPQAAPLSGRRHHHPVRDAGG